jgi:aryl-alcohol dehydrogenase-like predicted oxidoreductase
MKYRKLGTTELDVSAICLGTMTYGMQNSQEEAFEQMDYALSQGINFFDTAEMYAVPPSPQTYGRTETIIGNWFATRKNRDKVILASKIAGPGIPWIRKNYYKIDAENIRRALDDSLSRLRTDYIDLYQLHWPNRPDYHFGAFWNYDPSGTDKEAEEENFVEVLTTLNELMKEGKIRYAGLSNETSWGTMTWLRLADELGLPRMVSVQNEYSLLCRIFEPDLAEVAMRETIGLLAWSPLATGLLTGKYSNGKMPAGSRWTIGRKKKNQRDLPSAHAAADAYVALAREYGLDPAVMSLSFVNDRPFVTSTIIGATNPDQLKMNISSADVTLSDEILSKIDKIRRLYPIPF